MVNEINNTQNTAKLLKFSETPQSGSKRPDNGHSLPPSSISKSDTVSISDNARILQQINSLENQLDEIFGVPKQLTTTDIEQQEAIFKQVDQIFESYEPASISDLDEKGIDKILDQIDNIYADDQVTASEEKQLQSLEAELDKIFEPYEPRLSKADEDKLDTLFQQIDELEGYKVVNEQQQLQADKLLAELDGLFEKLDGDSPPA